MGKLILGIIGVIAGIALGLYVGVYLLLIGGIMGLVEVVNVMTDGGAADGGLIAWSVVKMLFSGVAGSISAYVLVLPSLALMSVNLGHTSKRKKRK